MSPYPHPAKPIHLPTLLNYPLLVQYSRKSYSSLPSGFYGGKVLHPAVCCTRTVRTVLVRLMVQSANALSQVSEQLSEQVCRWVELFFHGTS